MGSAVALPRKNVNCEWGELIYVLLDVKSCKN